jgi:phosphoheptose isomerase
VAASLLYKAYSDGSYVFTAGNGGAAAIADHMATDHAKHMAAVDTLYRNVHSLTSNSALTSALANDIGYDSIFSWQLEQFGHKDDVLVVFSVSGESANIIAALQRAQEMGMYSIAITGKVLPIIKEASPATVYIEIPATNYGICEDIMSIIQHALAQYVRQTQMSDHEIQSARF